MLILGVDCETNSLDLVSGLVTEVGAVLWDTDTHAPAWIYSDLIRWEGAPPQTEEIIRITGITDDAIIRHGRPARTVLANLNDACEHVEYIVAHNGTAFDYPMLQANFLRADLRHHHRLFSTPWVDTRYDLPWKTEPESRKLKHLALDIGFINPFPHRAVFDVLTMLKVMDSFPIEEVIAYSKTPNIVVAAQVSYDDRELAKAQRYSWEKLGEKTFTKKWCKQIKLSQLEAEQKRCKFPVVVIDQQK